MKINLHIKTILFKLQNVIKVHFPTLVTVRASTSQQEWKYQQQNKNTNYFNLLSSNKIYVNFAEY